MVCFGGRRSRETRWEAAERDEVLSWEQRAESRSQIHILRRWNRLDLWNCLDLRGFDRVRMVPERNLHSAPLQEECASPYTLSWHSFFLFY